VKNEGKKEIFRSLLGGLAFVDKNTFAVINDNDFGVNGAQDSIMGVITLSTK
jgi:hypothetical protein